MWFGRCPRFWGTCWLYLAFCWQLEPMWANTASQRTGMKTVLNWLIGWDFCRRCHTQFECLEQFKNSYFGPLDFEIVYCGRFWTIFWIHWINKIQIKTKHGFHFTGKNSRVYVFGPLKAILSTNFLTRRRLHGWIKQPTVSFSKLNYNEAPWDNILRNIIHCPGWEEYPTCNRKMEG